MRSAFNYTEGKLKAQFNLTPKILHIQVNDGTVGLGYRGPIKASQFSKRKDRKKKEMKEEAPANWSAHDLTKRCKSRYIKLWSSRDIFLAAFRTRLENCIELSNQGGVVFGSDFGAHEKHMMEVRLFLYRMFSNLIP